MDGGLDGLDVQRLVGQDDGLALWGIIYMIVKPYKEATKLTTKIK